jgi:hypothetical protein
MRLFPGFKGVLSAAIALSASTAIAQSAVPLELKDVHPGMSAAELQTAMPGIACRTVPDDQRARVFEADQACTRERASLGGAAAELLITLQKSHVTRVHFSRIGARQFDALSSMLTKKFGPPHDGDASSPARTLQWNRDGRTLKMLQPDPAGSVTVSLFPTDQDRDVANRLLEAKEADL